jgi:hypothetical protein
MFRAPHDGGLVSLTPRCSSSHDAAEQIRSQVVRKPRFQARKRLSFEPVTIDRRELPDEWQDGDVCQPPRRSAELASNRYPCIKVMQEANTMVAVSVWL